VRRWRCGPVNDGVRVVRRARRGCRLIAVARWLWTELGASWGGVTVLRQTCRLRAVVPQAYLLDALQRMGMRPQGQVIGPALRLWKRHFEHPQSRGFIEPGDHAAVAEAREAWQHDDSSSEHFAPAFVRRQRLAA
jgi:hypothetical protein